MSETTIFQSPADGLFYFWTPKHYKVGPYDSESACQRALEIYNSAQTTTERALHIAPEPEWCNVHKVKHLLDFSCEESE